MPTLAQNPAPSAEAAGPKRKVRNFLIDARFQLKFASYIVLLTLLVAGLLGVFLWNTTSMLFDETAVAVDARSRAAETSKELGNATLSNELMAHLKDPSFEAQLRAKSAEIDQTYAAERNSIVATRAALVRRQEHTLIALIGGFLAFIIVIALGTIVTTHKIVGPLYRLKRLAQEIGEGQLQTGGGHGLRPGDELKDVFEAFHGMIAQLRAREQQTLDEARRALALAEKDGSNAALIRELKTLEARVLARLE